MCLVAQWADFLPRERERNGLADQYYLNMNGEMRWNNPNPR